MSLQIFEYHGFPIQFDEVNGQIMANATLMCKAFAKVPNEWKSSESTQKYIDAITGKLRNSDIQLITSKAGNPDFGGGTWIHEKLILNLARWLDVEFEIWCDEKLTELFKYGKVELSPKSEAEQILDVITMLQIKVDKEKAERNKAIALLNEAKPKIEYYDKVLDSKGTLTTSVISTQLNIKSAQTLNKILKEKGIQYKVGGIWKLTTKYADKGLATIKTHIYTDTEGKNKTSHMLVWTEKGREFIMNLLGKNIAV